ncbi:fas-binding factor 1 homolog isoform X3 [Dermochelys coriacea]|uniref:fas-binding factor 1 homolog isoform X3 n=1 Tax=Dermochelys coriacea TaxID=27794 RepID=UPI0018E7044E|nr:fas-binding factor 1 homolog isoform X3 [Dermochelys coriacea]XP_043352302.1 fas-binding factor 1 homolog isoform X3 [Dermochelys coriacea]
MAAKPKKGLKGSIQDMLSDLLGDDDEIPIKSNKPSQHSGGGGRRSREIISKASKKSVLEDDVFSKMAAEDDAEAEGSDLSDVDPQALLETLQEMDDMEADLLGIKKSGSGAGRTTAKCSENLDSSGDLAKTAGKLMTVEKGESATGIQKKPLSTPATPQRQYKKFSFEDLDNPLAGLLSDEEEDAAKKLPPTGTKSSPERHSGPAKGTSLSSAPGHAVAPMRRREELTFEDDGDDLMDALGFGEGPRGELKQERKGEEEEPRPARSKLEELLGIGTAAKLLEQPTRGERKEFKLDTKYQQQPDKENIWGNEDFTFGAYQPTLASTHEGQQSRRQSVRFSAENINELKMDQRSKPTTPAITSPMRGNKTGADWLGLKDEDFIDLDPPSPAKDVAKGSPAAAPLNKPSSSSTTKRPSPASQLLLGTKSAAEEAAAKPRPLEEEDDSWLNKALSRKKSQVQGKVQEKRAGASGSLRQDDEVDPITVTSQQAPSVREPQRSAVPEDKSTRKEDSGYPGPWLTTQKQASSLTSESRKEAPPGDTSHAASLQGHPEGLGFSTLTPLLQAEPLALSLLNASEYEKRLVALQAQLKENAARHQVELLSAQTRLAELESQVRKLELERNQQKLLLESLQQRHEEDLELVENAHRSHVKVMEESSRQREARLRQENEELAAQYLSHCQGAERAKLELLAQQQCRLTELEQEKVQEVERLRELQQASILEMRKDHEEQLQRLKRLKDQEIDAVTSATSHTRSMNSIIEQMEKFSSNLNDLSYKVEATHHNTSQELEIGARQRDEQLRVLQDRLTRQQRDMEEERSRLQEVIAKMEARLSEQTRLLEQERWRVTAEQAKAESLQRSLEEQRRVMTQQLTMEREELERAKNVLLEEQKSVMQKCAEERRKLAMEWSEFHIQQKLSKERTERDVDRALQIDSQRECAIMTLAKEQADLKIKASELRAKEEQLARERESVEQERQELRLEKERVNAAALHVRQRAEEIDSMSKLSSQKYAEGERALLEAKKVESEHQTKLRTMQQRLEWLKQQEQHVHQELQNLAHQRRQLEQLREELPNSPVQFLTKPRVTHPGAQTKSLSTMHYFPPPVINLPWHNSGSTEGTQGTAGAGPAELYARLVLLKHTAERDRDFLEDEQFFLETLKKASYNMSSQTA